MEKQQSYEQLITEGIKGLPQELLAEIADFVYFIRQRFTQPQTFERNLETTLRDSPSTAPAADQATLTANGGWQSFAGTISRDVLQLMSEAIEAGCERVDLNEW